ncbi:MAG: hypothetical protein GHCLOJNM_02709 [bacterium]|nr:hypothetical protein [bacterium]
MKVCVVGGTGNISASVVRELLALGHEVVCFNRGTSRPPVSGARVIRGDRMDRGAFEERMRAEKFDAAFDFICFTREDAESSLRAFRGVGHLIHCSTVCTYGVDYDWLPVTEDHPLRPISDYGRNKVEADHVHLEAFHREGFPVTIIKPSSTYGPIMGCLRQVAWDFSWIDRVRKGKPILICGDGRAIHQFLHVDDAALGFAHVLGKSHTLGQTYNLVRKGFMNWREYHQTAMRVLGREVEMVGVPLEDLIALDVPEVGICRDIFAHNCYYGSERVFRDVPEFQPKISLERGLAQTIEALDREGRIPDSDMMTWEDRIITSQRRLRDLPRG